MFRNTITAAVLMFAAVSPTAQAQVYRSYRPTPDFGRFQQYHVQVRTWGWQERTFSSYAEARDYALFLRSQGREAFLNGHGAHAHVRFRAATWQTYRTVGSHREAHELERFLESRGQNARVIH